VTDESMVDRVTAEFRRAGLSPRTDTPASGGFGVEPSAPADPPDVAAYVVWNAADELAEPASDRLRAKDPEHRAVLHMGRILEATTEAMRAILVSVGPRRANEHRRPRPRLRLLARGLPVTRWIRSMGGPLVLLPRDALQVWTGAYGPDGEDDVDEEETDYWWVGEEVEDYADAVEVGGVSALILANGNSPMTFVPAHRLLLQRIAWDPTPTWWRTP
jgi:hypothetical protein